MMKKEYKNPEVDFIQLTVEDVMATSREDLGEGEFGD